MVFYFALLWIGCQTGEQFEFLTVLLSNTTLKVIFSKVCDSELTCIFCCNWVLPVFTIVILLVYFKEENICAL